jgi:putative sigma-54 modulation protein
LREYVLTKLDRVTRHFDQVVDVNVLLTVEKLKEKERRQKAEVTLHVKGRDIFVEQSHEDLYAAIDQLMDKLDRQVVRHKDRLQDHHHESPKRWTPVRPEPGGRRSEPQQPQRPWGPLFVCADTALLLHAAAIIDPPTSGCSGSRVAVAMIHAS